ncbi:hypothetical protein Cgig2_013492 [Carnegiea gigantea]|uniref:Uncharacterized protein n=1 Tax=Carnegiea gigantea TaxID=171969 RepID=A0A9Q1GNB6_9CARY|nr:hypothetical protein Cgig2_013492 [Carnegiea gigantea]
MHQPQPTTPCLLELPLCTECTAPAHWLLTLSNRTHVPRTEPEDIGDISNGSRDDEYYHDEYDGPQPYHRRGRLKIRSSKKEEQASVSQAVVVPAQAYVAQHFFSPPSRTQHVTFLPSSLLRGPILSTAQKPNVPLHSADPTPFGISGQRYANNKDISLHN